MDYYQWKKNVVLWRYEAAIMMRCNIWSLNWFFLNSQIPQLAMEIGMSGIKQECSLNIIYIQKSAQKQRVNQIKFKEIIRCVYELFVCLHSVVHANCLLSEMSRLKRAWNLLIKQMFEINGINCMRFSTYKNYEYDTRKSNSLFIICEHFSCAFLSF